MKITYSNKKNLSVRSLTHALLGILMLIAFETKSQTYCNNVMITSPQYEYISNVTFAGINNNTGTGSNYPTNFTYLTATVTPGNSYNIFVTGMTPNSSYPEWYKVWIDWNQNGLLSDAGEFYDIGYNGTLPVTVSMAIAVPANALPGTTRMRVMMAGNASGNTTNYAGSNPCYSSVGYGEVEDYNVLVLGPCSAVNTPTLSIASTTLCQGLPANITVSGSTPSLGITYQWQQSATPGGPYTNAGALSSIAAPQIPSITSGTNYYVLVATCSNGPVSVTSNQVVLTGSAVPVMPIASASQTGACVGNTITLNAQSSAGTTYQWTGPGFTSALQSPTLNNAPVGATGSYSVVANQYNCSSLAAVISITVSANPTAAIQASQPQFCLGGAPVTLTVNTNATAYLWSTGSNSQTTSVSPSATVPYTVTVQNIFGCISQAVYTVTAINATLSVLGDWDCNNGVGGSGVLTAQVFTPSTVYWYANPTATIIPLASGSANTLGISTFSINNSYADSTIYVQAKFGVCPSLLVPVTLTVSPQPTVSLVSFPSLNTSAPTITVCSNDTYTFTALGAASFTWSNGQTTASTDTFVIVPGTFTFFTNPNNYTISAISASGCTGSRMISLYVNISPVVSAATFTNNICPASNATLFTFGDANTYTWSANVNNSNAPAVVVSPDHNDVYTVVGTAVNGCTTAASQSITVYDSPTLTVTSQKANICAGETVSLTASGAVTYTWVANNFELQGPAAHVSPGATTNYQVTGADIHGCVSTATLQQAVSLCTGIQQASGNSNQIKVYPNPTNGEFTFELNNGADKTIELIDLTGRVVMTGTSGDDAVIINISQLSNGVYYLKVKSNNTVEVVKVVKR